MAITGDSFYGAPATAPTVLAADEAAVQFTTDASVPALAQCGICYDGVSVDYSALGIPAGHTPAITFGGGGVTYDSTLTSPQGQHFSKTNVTNTSFVPSLKIKELSGSTTHTAIPSGAPGVPYLILPPRNTDGILESTDDTKQETLH